MKGEKERERERQRERSSELRSEGLEQTGLPAGEKEGESVAATATGQRVRQKLPDLREKWGGVPSSVRLQIALRGGVGVPRGDTDGERGDLWQVVVNCGQ